MHALIPLKSFELFSCSAALHTVQELIFVHRHSHCTLKTPAKLEAIQLIFVDDKTK